MYRYTVDEVTGRCSVWRVMHPTELVELVAQTASRTRAVLVVTLMNEKRDHQ